MATYLPEITPDDGVRWIPADKLTPAERSTLASHLNVAVGALGMRGVDRLAAFADVVIDGHHLATDLADLEDIDDAGGFAEIDVFYFEVKD